MFYLRRKITTKMETSNEDDFFKKLKKLDKKK